jgi:hypothetical protein
MLRVDHDSERFAVSIDDSRLSILVDMLEYTDEIGIRLEIYALDRHCAILK